MITFFSVKIVVKKQDKPNKKHDADGFQKKNQLN